MNSEEFWCKIWKYIITGCTIAILGSSGCTMHRHYRIVEAIKTGGDPVRIGIALDGESTQAELVAALLSEKL